MNVRENIFKNLKPPDSCEEEDTPREILKLVVFRLIECLTL